MDKDMFSSAEHPPLTLLNSWLEAQETRNDIPPLYCHLLIRQKADASPDVWNELFTYINHAHEGARQALRAPLEDSLHPFSYNTNVDPAFGYPQKFEDSALKGFFGEIFAGIVAEHYLLDGEHKWEVPVYLFRNHIMAFQQLEYMKQTNDWKKKIVGRTGDDGLAFARDEDGRIVGWLACEAKCTSNHSSSLIKENHQKLSQAISRPIDLLRVIVALKDYSDNEYRQNWIAALLKYYWDDVQNTLGYRHDFSMYICGKCPTINATWISTYAPHQDYAGQRNLTSAEFQLPGLDAMIHSLYQMMENTE